MAHIALIGAVVVWGGAFIAGRVVVANVDPVTAAWLRFALAGVVLLALEALASVRRSRGGNPPAGAGTQGLRREPTAWWEYPLLGLSGVFGYNLFFFSGLARTTATESSLIVASSPIVVALMGLVWLRETLSPRKGCGIVLSVVGVVTIILGPAGAGGLSGPVAPADRLVGDVLMLGAVACWAVYSVLGKRVLRHVAPLKATARAVYWGWLFLTPALILRHGVGLGPALGSAVGSGGLGGLIYLALAATVFGFVAWYHGLKTLDVSAAAVFLNLVPISTGAIAALALGERLALPQLLGGLLVIGGVCLVGDGRASRRSGSAGRGPARPRTRSPRPAAD